MRELLSAGARAMGVQLNGAAIDRLSQYWDYLVDQNQYMNLTAITEAREGAVRHFLDSLALLLAGDLDGKRVIDVGSGAGFPGLPLKLARPTISLTLLDSQKKRVDFLLRLRERLDAADVSCVHGRAEELAHQPEYREAFDCAVSRAVARLNVLCELCLPYVKVGGRFLAMKTPHSEEETAEARHAVEVLGGALRAPVDYTLYGTEIQNRVIVIEKVTPTPAAYPRRFARIQKTPL